MLVEGPVLIVLMALSVYVHNSGLEQPASLVSNCFLWLLKTVPHFAFTHWGFLNFFFCVYSALLYQDRYFSELVRYGSLILDVLVPA